MIKQIEYENKQAIQNDDSIPNKNKVTAEDMNEIKETVNQNADELENCKTEIVRLRNDLQSSQLTGEANGESIDLNDSSAARFRKFGIGGNHKQETREGYNLLDFNVTQNGRVTVNEDGTIIINGTGGFTLAFKQFTAKANTKYYIKWELVSGTVDTSKSNGNSFLSPLDNTNIKQSEFKENVVENDKNINGFWVNNMTVFTNAVIKFWANTNKSDFEQYGASPSPDYPSEIKTVKDSVEIKVVNNDNTQEQTITMPVQQEMLEGDYFDWNNKKEVQTWGKYIFTGEESIVKSSMPQNNSYWINQETIPELLNAEVSTNTAILPQCICTHFKTLKPIKITNASNVGITINANNAEKTNVSIRIGFGINSEINTADKCKSLLKSFYEAGNPVIFYYKLSTLTQLDFTDEQKAVAKQIKETLHTYKNVTHIYSDDEISPIVNVEYAKDLNTTISNIQALVLNNASEEVSG